jgi:polar amino acid transport system substrate-binding protein
VAVVWMIASIIALAVFTAGITSAITTHQLQGLVRNVGDLHSLRVGAVGGSSSVDFLDTHRVDHQVFVDPSAGLKALQTGQIEAFIYDRPLLTWIVQQHFSGLQILGVTFGHQNYGIALPPNSDLRVPLDIALLENADGDWWKQILTAISGRPARCPAIDGSGPGGAEALKKISTGVCDRIPVSMTGRSSRVREHSASATLSS